MPVKTRLYEALVLSTLLNSAELWPVSATQMKTRSSADADNTLDAFAGQSRPCGISDGTPTHVRHMINVVTLKLGSEVTQGH